MSMSWLWHGKAAASVVLLSVPSQAVSGEFSRVRLPVAFISPTNDPVDTNVVA
jgi:hypothetical protein